MLHRVDLLGCCRVCENHRRLGSRVQLAQSGFMAMIWLVLRNKHNVRFRDMREIGDARCDGVFGGKEFGVPHGTWTAEPWVHKNAEGPWRLLMTWRLGGLFFGRKCK